MGLKYESAPDEFRRFISEAPACDAFEDFSRWDEVIEKGFTARILTKQPALLK